MLTYFEGRVAAALEESKPRGPDETFLERSQWRADVLAIASKLDIDRAGFETSEFVAACGGIA